MRTKVSLDFAEAESMAAGAGAAAARLGARVAIAVVDDAGVLMHFQRLEGARSHTVDLAIRKARTAATLSLSTRLLEQMAKEGRLQNSEALALAGGVPVTVNGDCAGALGVSGSTSEIDDEIANAGLAVLSPRSTGL